MDDDFRIKLEESILYVNLGYELTSANAPKLLEALKLYQDQVITKLVFDATELVYISSSGLRVITYAYQKLGHNPKIEFVNCAQKMYEVLDLVGFTNFISFVEDKSKNEHTDVTDCELQKKLRTLNQEQLDYFSANNDVVMYQMKLGHENR